MVYVGQQAIRLSNPNLLDVEINVFREVLNRNNTKSVLAYWVKEVID
jgi:hypothetical protein